MNGLLSRAQVTRRGDPQRRRTSEDAVRFFNAKKKRFGTIRGDIGGHYPESAATWACENNSTRP